MEDEWEGRKSRKENMLKVIHAREQGDNTSSQAVSWAGRDSSGWRGLLQRRKGHGESEIRKYNKRERERARRVKETKS